MMSNQPSPIYNKLMSFLHGGNIYNGFEPSPSNIQGYNNWSHFFNDIISTTRPAIIIEIGSWYGNSAIQLANCVRSAPKLSSIIICIDTWLGSQEHWGNKEQHKFLLRSNGYPQIYHQFLSNIINAGYQDLIVPIPLPSLIALRLLDTPPLKIRADMIYVDGSHNELDLYNDLIACLPLMSDNCILCGDDYCWKSVEKGLTRFVLLHDMIDRLAIGMEPKYSFWKISPRRSK